MSEKRPEQRQLSRRGFLKQSLGATVGTVLAAHGMLPPKKQEIAPSTESERLHPSAKGLTYITADTYLGSQAVFVNGDEHGELSIEPIDPPGRNKNPDTEFPVWVNPNLIIVATNEGEPQSWQPRLVLVDLENPDKNKVLVFPTGVVTTPREISVSPDGTKVAVVISRASADESEEALNALAEESAQRYGDRGPIAHRDQQLIVINPSTGERSALPDADNPEYIVFSQWTEDDEGNKYIVYESNTGADGRIGIDRWSVQIVPVDGGEPRKLAEGGYAPTVHGENVVYVKAEEIWDTNYSHLLFQTDLKGNPEPLTNTEGKQIEGDFPAFSPNGKEIAYVNPDGDVAIYNLDTKEVTVLTDGTDIKVDNSYKYYTQPLSWKEDGTLALLKEGGGSSREIWIISSDGTLSRVAEDADPNTRITWRPQN